MNREKFLQLSSLATASIGLPNFLSYLSSNFILENNLFFDISLAQWSLHRSLFNGKINHLEFPATAKNEFGIEAVEYVSQFFAERVTDQDYLDEMNTRCADLGVDQLLIMVDGEGELAVADDSKRQQAVKNHYKWVEAAEYLGCHSIRVNTYGDGTPESQKMAAVEGLSRLAEFAQDYNINVIVENHGGYSSNGQWLSEVIAEVDMNNCGTLPDFGNFCLEENDSGCIKEYDRYKGVKEMMPYAKGVSAKSYNFNKRGEETTINFERMLTIVREADYRGHVGIEYEGDQLSEYEGILATKNLLEVIGKELAE